MKLEISIPDSVQLDAQTTVNYRAFLQLMSYRRVVGALRYGDIPTSRQKYFSRMKREIKAYEQTGNFEHLLNIANYAFLEGNAPENPKLHFDPSADSVTRPEFGGEVPMPNPTPQTAQRDPRREPKSGDVARKGKLRRKVTRVKMGSEIFYLSGESKVERSCWITTWQDWCRGAEVLHVAE